MATIGMKDLVYSKISLDAETGEESYSAVKKLAKAINADLSVDVAEAILYADDGAAETAMEFAGGTLSIGVDDLTPDVQADLTGETKDGDEVVSYGEDSGGYVAVGFRAKKSDGRYRCIWLLKVKFGAPSESYETKKESIDFKTPTIEGKIMQRTKADSNGKHAWRRYKDCDETAAQAYLKSVPTGGTSTASLAKE
ncbi:MAG: phage tail protein [Oscillospiraceae bacterium]|nr:phage tail protein [Oscillospiraceae bacterium]